MWFIIRLISSWFKSSKELPSLEDASKKEEKLSRTQELNTAKVQALRDLGYDKIDEKNASEVLDKIAEIMSQKF